MNIYPDVQQCFFDVLAKYNWVAVPQAKQQQLCTQLRDYLLSKGVAVKSSDWSWIGSVPTLRVSRDTPQMVVDVLNLFDWKTLPVDMVQKMAADADVYLHWAARIPRK